MVIEVTSWAESLCRACAYVGLNSALDKFLFTSHLWAWPRKNDTVPSNLQRSRIMPIRSFGAWLTVACVMPSACTQTTFHLAKRNGLCDKALRSESPEPSKDISKSFADYPQGVAPANRLAAVKGRTVLTRPYQTDASNENVSRGASKCALARGCISSLYPKPRLL